MLLAHAIALAEARSYLAALADQSDALKTTVAYDDALLYLDSIHADQVPALELLPPLETGLLHVLTEKALTDLAPFGLDPLHLELLLAMIGDAREDAAAAMPPDPGRES
ncbi:hypothetical protein ACFWQC_02975 [Nocardioides sp. NPDC058538]|uniref:hypothetical protein n=1 Tax=Nocardioides sp. NPDC058538 TaxID=3346542 RepID=UPI00364F14BB